MEPEVSRTMTGPLIAPRKTCHCSPDGLLCYNHRAMNRKAGRDPRFVTRHWTEDTINGITERNY